MNVNSNPCYRCGKERIFVRTWTEKIGHSTVTTTEKACPDPECQKLLDKENKKRMDRLKASQTRRKESLHRNGKRKTA